MDAGASVRLDPEVPDAEVALFEGRKGSCSTSGTGSIPTPPGAL